MTIDQNSEDTLGYRRHPAISNSDLKSLSYSPKKFKLYKEGSLEKEQSSLSQDFGTLVDLYFLDREAFNKKVYVMTSDITKPSTSAQQLAVAEAALAGQNHVDAYRVNYSIKNKTEAKIKEEADIILLAWTPYMDIMKEMKKYELYCSPEDNAKIANLEMNTYNHIQARKILLDKPEEGVQVYSHLQIVNVLHNNIYWKCEIDRLIIDFNEKRIYNIDLKTTKSLATFPWDYKKYRYHRQQALYEMLIKYFLTEKGIITDWSEWMILTRVVAMESTGLHEVRVIPITNNILEEGRKELTKAMETLNWHKQNDQWEYPRSYYENNGLTYIDWDEIYDFEADDESN